MLRIFVAALAFIVTSLFILTAVGEPTCTDGPDILTVGDAAKLILMVTVICVLSWGMGYSCGEDDQRKKMR